MTDLRKAAEMALEALEEIGDEWGFTSERTVPNRTKAIQALRQALAQPEQEPVCFLRETSWSYEIAPWDDPNGFPVYTSPPKQEYQYEVVAEHANGTRTTKRMPKREWVGLTDEEKEQATGWSVEHIEAKLKDKNAND